MSIDYDRLRTLVGEMEQGVAATTRYTWLDLARELLRLRDGVEATRDELQAGANLFAADGIRTVATYVRGHAHALTDLLKGNNE